MWAAGAPHVQMLRVSRGARPRILCQQQPRRHTLLNGAAGRHRSAGQRTSSIAMHALLAGNRGDPAHAVCCCCASRRCGPTTACRAAWEPAFTRTSMCASRSVVVRCCAAPSEGSRRRCLLCHPHRLCACPSVVAHPSTMRVGVRCCAWRACARLACVAWLVCSRDTDPVVLKGKDRRVDSYSGFGDKTGGRFEKTELESVLRAAGIKHVRGSCAAAVIAALVLFLSVQLPVSPVPPDGPLLMARGGCGRCTWWGSLRTTACPSQRRMLPSWVSARPR